jgi:hypothetical protein
MIMKLIDLTGKKFERWHVLKRVDSTKKGGAVWLCLCACGEQRIVQSHNLIAGLSRSCGCLKNEVTSERSGTHRKTKTRTYYTWANMKRRCRSKNLKNYGGRGISVCDRWLTFENFYADMGDIPDGMTLERTDNSAGYSPENCKWATATEQSNNKRNNKKLEWAGECLTVTQWAKKLGVTRETIRGRMRLNWPVDKIFTTQPCQWYMAMQP